MDRYRLRINVVKIILFFILLAVMLNRMLNIFNYKDMGGGAGWQRLYQMEKNSVDVMFFGSSHAHCTVNHGFLWENYGIAGYTLSSGSQNIDSTYYFIKQSLPVQRPKVIVVEVLSAIGGSIGNSDVAAYRALLGTKWSGGYLECLNYFSEDMNLDSSQRQEILFKFPIIHSRYKELKQSDFKDTIPFMRGYRGSFDIFPCETPSILNGESMELDARREEMLLKIINLAKTEDIPLLLFAAPFVLNEGQKLQYNRIAEIAEENQIPFIDFNHLYDETGIDFQCDFRDEQHLNNYGADKVTDYLARYLKDNYSIPDRRGEKGYELWDQNALYLKNKVLCNMLEGAEDINEYLQFVSQVKDEQTVLLALSGNYGALGEVYLENLTLLGITLEEYQNGGLWIWRNGTRYLYLPGREYSRCIRTDVGEIHVESTLSTNNDGDTMDSVRLLINGKDYRMVENGVNIVIYNEYLDQLIDAAGDNVYMGLEMTHYEKPEE